MTVATIAQQAITVGAYLRDLPPDRRVAMARVCSMIRRSARGVRESMRYGLAFYELDGPLFALESGRRHMSLYVAEQDVVARHKDALPGVNAARSYIKFSDLNRLPLDIVEKIVRDSVAARRTRVTAGTVPTQAELLKLWAIKEEAAAPPAVVAKALAPATEPALTKVVVAKTAAKAVAPKASAVKPAPPPSATSKTASLKAAPAKTVPSKAAPVKTSPLKAARPKVEPRSTAAKKASRAASAPSIAKRSAARRHARG